MRLEGFQQAEKAVLGKVRAVALALLFVLPSAALGQTAPTTIAQAVAPAIIVPFDPTLPTDFREQMRGFVQSISDYARSLNPRFVVIARGGLALVGKPDPEDDARIFPARTYMRAIDGVMESTLLDERVTTPEGKPDPELEAVVKRRTEDLKLTQSGGLSIFDLEYSTDAKTISALYANAAKKGYIPFVAESPELSTIPRRPTSAYQANPLPIATPTQARNYLYVANTQGFGNTSDFVQAVRGTNHDVVVVDVFQGRQPLTRQDVDLLRYKKLGAPRLVLAQVDIGSIASFDYFWKPNWAQGNPSFISAPYREDPDRHRTIYWDPAWQAIITGDFNSYIYGVVDLGFDGVVLKGVDAWRYFETGGEEG